MDGLCSATVGELLAQNSMILAELRHRRITRTNNAPLGDVAENCAQRVYGGKLEPNSNPTIDLTTHDRTRIQVKCRQLSENSPKARRFSPLRSLDLDLCLFLVVDGEQVIRASEWTRSDVEDHGTWKEKNKAWSVRVRQVLQNPQIGTDRTEEFHVAWRELLGSAVHSPPVSGLEQPDSGVTSREAMHRAKEQHDRLPVVDA